MSTVEVLIRSGVSVDKQLNTFYNKITPLMIAAARGDLPMVKLLVETGWAKVERPDRHRVWVSFEFWPTFRQGFFCPFGT